MQTKYLLPLLLFIVLVVALQQGLYLQPKDLNSALLGKNMPRFALPNLSNPEQIVTESIFKNKISVVNVWASWCNACSEEHVMLNSLAKTNQFQLVGINYKDLKNNADQWLNKLGNPYTVNIFDTNGLLGMDLGIYGTPTTYIIDGAGVIRYRHVGILTNKQWNTLILPQINKLKT